MIRDYHELWRKHTGELNTDIDILRNPSPHITVNVRHGTWPTRGDAHIDTRLKSAINTGMLAMRKESDGRQSLHRFQNKPRQHVCQVLAHIPVQQPLLDDILVDYAKLFGFVEDYYNKAWPGLVALDWNLSLRNVNSTDPHAIRLCTGKDDPRGLIDIAEQWNRDRQNEAAELISAASTCNQYGIHDNDLMEQLRLSLCSLMEAPDPFGHHLTLLKPMHFIFGTLVNNESLKHLKDHPDEYALIPVVPKLATED